MSIADYIVIGIVLFASHLLCVGVGMVQEKEGRTTAWATFWHAFLWFVAMVVVVILGVAK